MDWLALWYLPCFSRSHLSGQTLCRSSSVRRASGDAGPQGDDGHGPRLSQSISSSPVGSLGLISSSVYGLQLVEFASCQFASRSVRMQQRFWCLRKNLGSPGLIRCRECAERSQEPYGYTGGIPDNGADPSGQCGFLEDGRRVQGVTATP